MSRGCLDNYESNICCRSNSLHVTFRARQHDDSSSAKRTRILTSENETKRLVFKSKQSHLLPEFEKVPQGHETSAGEEMLQDDTISTDSMQSQPVEGSQGRKVSSEQTSEVVASLVRRTQRVMTLEDTSLREHLANIYRELGSNRAQVQRLTEALGVHERKSRRRLGVSEEMRRKNCSPLRSSSSLLYSEYSEYSESEATDIFFDCVSRFSKSPIDSSIERLQEKFSGSPDYLLETSAGFFPEQYTSSDMFDATANLVAIRDLQSTATDYVRKFFLQYAKTPRNWQKVTVTATIAKPCQRSLSEGNWFDYNSLGLISIPKLLAVQLKNVLQNELLLDTVTGLSVTVRENSVGEITLDRTSATIDEDFEESHVLDEQHLLQDIDDMGCPQFLESEVIMISRLGTYTYTAQVESRKCIETKMPFGGAGPPGTSEIKDFVNRLKQLSLSQGCDNITRFVGVVLNDSRSHLRSFLKESLPVPSLYWMFAGAEKEKEWIPWSIRELWAKQLVSAVSDVHARGLVIGGFGTRSGIGIRANGSIVLDPDICNPGYQTDAYGKLPPELRKRRGERLSTKDFNSFRMDLFYLGMALWLIAKHRADFTGCFCALNVCTNWPRYSCTADHGNPIELPRLSNMEVPKYFDLIVDRCRQSEPSARLPARLLLRYFDSQPLPSEAAKLLVELVKKYDHSHSNVSVTCDECGSLMEDYFFTCNACEYGDLDFCSDCISSGVHCRVSEHQMQKVKV